VSTNPGDTALHVTPDPAVSNATTYNGSMSHQPMTTPNNCINMHLTGENKHSVMSNRLKISETCKAESITTPH